MKQIRNDLKRFLVLVTEDSEKNPQRNQFSAENIPENFLVLYGCHDTYLPDALSDERDV